MQTGKINVQTENIFPIIKKFLYSDHEIFLRELVSNAVDACQKLKTLSALGESSADTSNLLVEVIVDKDAKTITISDNGIGMTDEDVVKYIAQIAFSGAEEFVNKYKDKQKSFCKMLQVEPSNTMLFGLGTDGWEMYNRGGPTNRLGLHNFLHLSEEEFKMHTNK